MLWSFDIGRIAGTAIKVHVTFVLILVWAAYFWGIETGAGLQGALFGVVATLLGYDTLPGATITLYAPDFSSPAAR